MSWKDQLENTLTIVCGDGKSYSPFWTVLPYTVEYNISSFEFPNLIGTLVNPGFPKGRRFEMEIFFQGEDHIFQSESFRISAGDKRPWTMNHPLYGPLLVRPVSLSFDATGLGVTRITGLLIETISESYPKTAIDPQANAGLLKDKLDATCVDALTAKPSRSDINTVTGKNNKNFKLAIKKIKLPEEAETFMNALNNANATVQNLTASPLEAMRQTIALISAPFRFTLNVKTRMDMLNEQFQNIRTGIIGITAVASKQLFQNMAGSVLSTQMLTAINPLKGDYSKSTDALSVIDVLVKNYNTFISDIDSLQTLNGGTVLSFIPDANVVIQLNNLLHFTISNLMSIALDGKYERSVILEEDSNVILLTHRFYGLDENDENINEFMDNNNIGLHNILQIKRGTKIIYYT
ncbi:MAG: hypothetical protein U0T32_11980 [Chitinophagales bacterium]